MTVRHVINNYLYSTMSNSNDMSDRFEFNISRPTLNKGEKNMEKVIEIGEYKLPPDCVAKVANGILTIREKKNPFTSETVRRCRECEFYGEGYTFADAWYMSNVCHKKPKGNHVGVFYAASPYDKACKSFKRRTIYAVR